MLMHLPRQTVIFSQITISTSCLTPLLSPVPSVPQQPRPMPLPLPSLRLQCCQTMLLTEPGCLLPQLAMVRNRRNGVIQFRAMRCSTLHLLIVA
jgi:hypothetical protein